MNGEPRGNVSVSPGFNGVYLQAGDHEVEFRYGGANNARLGNWVSASTLLVLVALTLRGRRRRSAAEAPASERLEERDRASPLVLLPVAALAVLLAIPWVEQAILRTPVAQYPLAWSEISGFAIRAHWRPIAGEDVTCDVQVAGADVGFEDPMFEQRGIRETSSDRIRISPGRYRWRVRCSADGRPHRWSRSVPFRIL